MACCRVGSTECSSLYMGPFEEVTIIFITSTVVWSQVNNREGIQLHPTTENWIKDFFFFNFFFLILFYFQTSHNCISFAKYQNESATGIHVFPTLNPPPSSLPIPSLWVVPVQSWPHTSGQDQFFSVSLSHQEASISLLSFSLRGQTDLKPQSQKTNQSDHMDHSSV